MVKITRNMDITPKEEAVKNVGKEKKNKFSASRLAIVLFLVILTAGATGGVMWYFMDQVNTTNKNTINDLRNQITKISDDTKKDTDEEESETNELVYKNSDYNFEMELTKNWEGYKLYKYVDAKDSSALAYYYVALPTKDSNWDESPAVPKGYASLFAISVHTKDQWEELSSTEGPAGGEFVKENDDYVISWSHAQAGPTEGMDESSDYSKANDDIPQIINSIKFSN